MKKILLAIIILLGLSACKTKSISLQVQRPAQVNIPTDIKSLVVVNRTFSDNAASFFEGIFTGELASSDKANVEECMNGLESVLVSSDRFRVARANEILPNNNAIKNFSQPVPWEIIDELCRKYGADALLALEFFDTDFIVTKGDREQVTVKNEGKDSVRTTVYWAEGLAQVNAGFRIYDPERKSIVYQDRFNSSRKWKAEGKSITDAMAGLIAHDRATKAISYQAGDNFGKMIVPLFFWENRTYFKGKSPLMQKAGRLAQVKDWDKATDTWKEVILSEWETEKGEAAYNLALACEVQGELGEAKYWVRKAYADYGIKKARAYAEIIEQRIRNEELLKQQYDQ